MGFAKPSPRFRQIKTEYRIYSGEWDPGTPFVTLHLAGGVDLAYLLPANVTFESRKKYLYHITVSRAEITLTTSVSDWTAGGLVKGEASHLVN